MTNQCEAMLLLWLQPPEITSVKVYKTSVATDLEEVSMLVHQILHEHNQHTAADADWPYCPIECATFAANWIGALTRHQTA